jgi:hypothetical protein
MSTNPEIIAAMITAAGTIIASFILAVGAWITGRIIVNRRRLLSYYNRARADLAFQMAVEEAHCQKLKEETGESHRMRIRSQDKTETGMDWSGLHTPGQKNPWGFDL